ncbi:MAG TPA: myo-inositol-1-phosphate synthase [Thermoplasmatales archaeon]|nr:myo-inositol-1-phosphate synthase [Thermoplasmatales archaeon]
MRTAIFGQGYVASILNVGLERIKKGEIGYEGIPLGDALPLKVEDIEIVTAFDIDETKVGRRLSKVVKRYWDGDINFERDYIIKEGYRDYRGQDAEIDLEEAVGKLIDEYEKKDVDIFVNLITTEHAEPFMDIKELRKAIKKNDVDRISPAQLYFYSVATYERPTAFINCIPTQLANDPAMVQLAKETKTVLFGDDGASGATPLTADLLEHLKERRRRIKSICQFNIGGNTDFLSLTEPERNFAKEVTKSSIVEDILGYDVPHYIKPTGYLEPLGDKKFVSMHISYTSFNGAEDEWIINARINDSPALAGLIVDLIRLARMAIDREEYGTIYPVNAFYMKMPGPRDAKSVAKVKAFEMLNRWVNMDSEKEEVVIAEKIEQN